MNFDELVKPRKPLTPEEEIHAIGIRAIQSQIEQSREYIRQAQEEIKHANSVIEVQTQQLKHYLYLLSEIEKAKPNESRKPV